MTSGVTGARRNTSSPKGVHKGNKNCSACGPGRRLADAARLRRLRVRDAQGVPLHPGRHIEHRRRFCVVKAFGQRQTIVLFEHPFWPTAWPMPSMERPSNCPPKARGCTTTARVSNRKKIRESRT